LIIACIIVFNEEKFIERCLRSLKNKADRIIVVDGVYKDFPHEIPHSTDRTIQIIQDITPEASIIQTLNPWHSQVEKRNFYLGGEKGDWYFHIDADEELVGKLPNTARLNREAYNIQIRGKHSILGLRLFKHQDGIHYEGAHNALWVRDRLLRFYNYPILSLCYLKHHSEERDEERKKAQQIYYGRQYEAEKEFRKQYVF